MNAVGKSAIPPWPVDERARLAALERYRILDTPPEEAFDRITRLAATLFDMPISLITLLDERRQWFKSHHGLDVSCTGRDIAFCSYAILEDEPFVVQDTLNDERFAGNPLVTGELGIRFYAGAPLRTADGFLLGTLCVLDRQPHYDFGLGQVAVLRDLEQLVVHEIEGRKAALELRQEIEEHKQTEERLKASLREKETLLREVHHRVKNNLQSIWGMLQVEQSRLKHNPEASSRLATINQRLIVLGRIHQQLYKSGDFTRLDLATHLDQIAKVQDMDGRITVSVDADPLCCDLEIAMPFGLIAHELILNAMKHAYPDDGGGGPIPVALKRQPDGSVELSVTDEGPGLPSTGCETKGIGMMLINALAEQINAEVSFGSNHGCCARIRMPGALFSS